MIRLFGISDKTYTSNGDVVLNPIKCSVKNADNGDFTLSATCTLEYLPYIVNNAIIVAPTPAGDQPFRIYDVQKNNYKVEVKAKHVTHDADNYVIADAYVVDKDGEEALLHLNNATDTTSPFTVSSDVLHVDSYRCVRKSLEEAINEVAERWGGHIVRKDWTISLLTDISRDNGITIEYGKNLQSITADYDFSDVCTKVLPVGKDGQLLDTLFVVSSTQYEIPFTKVVTFEQDIDEEDYPTEEEYIEALKADLLEQALEYVNTYCVPSVNYTLKGKPEVVSDIGDVIRVYDKRLGVNITTQVISYEFDCIAEKYKSLEFGNFQKTLGDLVDYIKSKL